MRVAIAQVVARFWVPSEGKANWTYIYTLNVWQGEREEFRKQGWLQNIGLDNCSNGMASHRDGEHSGTREGRKSGVFSQC